MDLVSLFTSTRWDILEQIAKEPSAPIELAEILNTTSANISQQLRLLELAGLVRSERNVEREKGKPRVRYSLANDFAYLIVTTPSFVQKKLLPLSSFQKFILKVLLYENTDEHKRLIDFFFAVQDHLETIDIIAIDMQVKKLTLVIVTEDDKKELVTSIPVKKYHAGDLKDRISELYILYDPSGILGGKEVKANV